MSAPASDGPAAPETRVEAIVNALTAYGPEKIILFGAAARGDGDEQSDIDLLIVKKTETRFVRRAIEADSYLPLDISVDLFVYTPEEMERMIEEENPFIERALRDGKVVYEKAPGDGKTVAGTGAA